MYVNVEAKFLPFRVIIIYAEEMDVWVFVVVTAVIQWCAGKYGKLWFLAFAMADFKRPDVRALALGLGRE